MSKAVHHKKHKHQSARKLQAPQPTPAATGTCPQAANMGMTSVQSQPFKATTKMCSLQNTCCDQQSMDAWVEKYNTFAANMSSMIWSTAKFPNTMAHLMSGLKKGYGQKTSGSRILEGTNKKKFAARALQRVVSNGSSTQSSEKTALLNNSTEPNHWNVGQSWRGTFVTAWNSLNDWIGNRGQFYNSAHTCVKGMLTLKTQLACAACDPANEDNLKDKAKIKPASLKDFQEGCAGFLYEWEPINDVFKKVMAYITAVSNTDELKRQVGILDHMDIPKLISTYCFEAASSSSSGGRRLQAPQPDNGSDEKVKVLGWKSWQANNNVKALPKFKLGQACLEGSSPSQVSPLQVWITHFIFGDNFEQFNEIVMKWFNALNVAMSAAADPDTTTAWQKFKAQIIKTTVPSRRMQAVQSTARKVITSEDSGIDLAKQPKTKLVVVEMSPGKDQVEMALSNLAKIFSVLAAIGLFMFN